MLLFQISLSVFAVYVLIDSQNVLDAQKIFVSVALINILKTPLSQLPFAMSTTMQASTSQSDASIQIYCQVTLMVRLRDLRVFRLQTK